MPSIIAVQPDRFASPWGVQSFSAKWLTYLEEAPQYEARVVNIYGEDPLASLAGADAFMWRGTGRVHARAAKGLIPAIECAYGIPTFPSSRLSWLTRDKVAQSLAIRGLGLPSPETWIFFRYDDAKSFVERAEYPLVVKLSNGRGSEGVALVRNRDEARRYVDAMFLYGVTQLDQALGSTSKRHLGRLRSATRYLCGKEVPDQREGSYAYFQEFLPGNKGDTRVTVIGRYATAFRRINRPGDFRASGSGRFEFSSDQVEEPVISLAFEVSRKLECPFLAIDFLQSHGGPVVCELNFAYISAPVGQCANHWVLEDGKPVDEVAFRDGSIDPEIATIQEFLRLNRL